MPVPEELRSALEVPAPGAQVVWSAEWHEVFEAARELAGTSRPHTGHLLLALLRAAPGWEPLAPVAAAVERGELGRALREQEPDQPSRRGLGRRRGPSPDVDRARAAYLDMLRPHLSRVVMPADRRHLAAVCLQPGSVAGDAVTAAGVDVEALLATLLGLVLDEAPGQG